MTPEVKLFQAVVAQALSDATHTSKTKEAEVDRRAARRWLLAGGADFNEVCLCANYDPSYVRKGAERLAARGWPTPKKFLAEEAA